MATLMTKDEIITKLGIEKVNSETQNEILDDLASTVSARLINKVYEQLSAEDLEQLNSLIDSNDNDAVEWFIKSKFENYDEMAIATENEVILEVTDSLQAF